ncbi:epididymal protein 13 [Fukomys damarensis]|uniref:epididymal protein 13 n=1 Tax=Fukomys damarensis TaxID=885580 RepID=UPI001455C3B0|nr:epididymal protein 13 [Fukomys damarensis]
MVAEILGLLGLQVLNDETNDCREERPVPATSPGKPLQKRKSWSLLKCTYMALTFLFVSYNTGDWKSLSSGWLMWRERKAPSVRGPTEAILRTWPKTETWRVADLHPRASLLARPVLPHRLRNEMCTYWIAVCVVPPTVSIRNHTLLHVLLTTVLRGSVTLPSTGKRHWPRGFRAEIPPGCAWF